MDNLWNIVKKIIPTRRLWRGHPDGKTKKWREMSHAISRFRNLLWLFQLSCYFFHEPLTFEVAGDDFAVLDECVLRDEGDGV